MKSKKYYCNDCKDDEAGPPYVGACELSLPLIAAKPKYCPIFDECIVCDWIEKEEIEKLEAKQ